MALRCRGDGCLDDHRGESERKLFPAQSGPLCRTAERAPAKSRQRTAKQRRGPTRGGEHGAREDVAPYRLRRDIHARIQKVLPGFPQGLFLTGAASLTSSEIAASVDRFAVALAMDSSAVASSLVHSARSQNSQEAFCGADFPGVALILRETSAALAG